MFYSQNLDDLSELHIFQDKKLDLYAAICLHRYGRDNAIGGCRFIEYPSKEEATFDAIRLSKAMGYKAAISELEHDGGKAVILKSKQIQDREMVLQWFAKCVDSLEGKYITTVDSGTTQADMSIIKKFTSHVTGYLEDDVPENNPSHYTAIGVFKGIEVAAKLRLNAKNLSGLHVAIQGVGSVGYRLAKRLYTAGAQLTVCDIDAESVERCVNEFKAMVVAPDDIYKVKCDVFAPCALGQILNGHNISQLSASIIAGAANDQLLNESMLDSLQNKDILYIPDYLINAGGLIHLALQRQGKTPEMIEKAVIKIADRIDNLANIAKEESQSLYYVTHRAAEKFMRA